MNWGEPRYEPIYDYSGHVMGWKPIGLLREWKEYGRARYGTWPNGHKWKWWSE
jgi:hypothetical protein